MEGCLNWGWVPIILECGGTGGGVNSRQGVCRDTDGFMIWARGPIISGWRWFYTLQPTSDQPTGLGLLHRAGGCRPGRNRISSPGVGVVEIWKDV